MRMQCPTCKRSMTLLFTSAVCDWCDGLKKPEVVDRGWVVVPYLVGPEGMELYVFPSPEMAMYFQRAQKLGGQVRKVLSEQRIRWRDGTGTLPNLRVADRRYTVYPDFKFEPGPYRAYLAPITESETEIEVEAHAL